MEKRVKMVSKRERSRNEKIQKVSRKINWGFQVRAKHPQIYLLYLSAYSQNQPLTLLSTFIISLPFNIIITIISIIIITAPLNTIIVAFIDHQWRNLATSPATATACAWSASKSRRRGRSSRARRAPRRGTSPASPPAPKP